MDAETIPIVEDAVRLTDLVQSLSDISREIHTSTSEGEWMGRFESDVQHSYHLAVMTDWLIPHLSPGLDREKAIRLALYHDILETKTGDFSIWSVDRHRKVQLEDQAEEEIAVEWRDAFPTLVETIHEYQQKASPESRFVWSLDKIVSTLMLIKSGGSWWIANRTTIEMQLDYQDNIRPKIVPELTSLYDALRQEVLDHPEYFYKETQ